MSIRFIADSAADLPKDFIEKNNIDIFPLYIHHDNEIYKDGIDLKAKELYKRMKDGEMFKTSQVSVNVFLEKFKEYAKKDEKVIYLSLSSKLSGTFQSAVLAKREVKEKYPDFDITLIDSRSASMGVGLIIYKLIHEYKEKDLTKDEIIEKAKYYSSHMEHIFTVDDLDYLVKGGRLNKIAGFVGGILKIKPIIEVKNGSLEQSEKIKGDSKVMKRMLEIVMERATNLEKETLAIVHADNEKTAKKLKNKILEKTSCDSIILSDIGAVIGAHAGPGTYGVFFINENTKINDIEIQ